MPAPSLKSSVLRPLLALTAVAALTGACATAPTGARPLPPPSGGFQADDFAWSARAGQSSINGRIEYRQGGQSYRCTGSVGLTPETPYTRARFQTLYGATDRAAVPAAVVRARTVDDAGTDYRSYVRSSPCSDNRFSFSGLPDGGWFVIVPVSAGGETVVLMRRVETRGGRAVDLTL